MGFILLTVGTLTIVTIAVALVPWYLGVPLCLATVLFGIGVELTQGEGSNGS